MPTRQELLAALMQQQNVSTGAANPSLRPIAKRPTGQSVDRNRMMAEILSQPVETPQTQRGEIAPVDSQMVAALSNIGTSVWGARKRKQAEDQSRELLAQELAMAKGGDPFASELQPIVPPVAGGQAEILPGGGSEEALAAALKGVNSYQGAAQATAADEAPARAEHDLAAMLDPRASTLATKRLFPAPQEPYTLGPGETRYLGNKKVASNSQPQYEMVAGPNGAVLQRNLQNGEVSQILGREADPGKFEMITGPDGSILQKNLTTGAVTSVIPRQPNAPADPLVSVVDPTTGRPVLKPRSEAAGLEPYQKPTGGLSPRDATTAKNKLTQIRLARKQVALAKEKFKDIKGTTAAGPWWLGQGGLAGDVLNSGKGELFDAAVDSMRSTITGLLKVPGLGSMSDFETKLDQAKMPTRSKREATTEQQLESLDTILNGLEQGYGGMLADAGGLTAPDDDAAPDVGDEIPPVGAEIEGYRFKGGDPADQNNWEPL